MKVIILRHKNVISHEYAAIAAESCDKHSMQWEYFEGFSNIKGSDALKSIGIAVEKETQVSITSSENKAQLCTASHVALWKKMIDEKIYEAVILEHDAIMLHKPTIEIPDNTIVALGYKIPNPDAYNHVVAGPPTKIQSINKFQGSHAYAITNKTARQLIDNVKRRGSAGCIDRHWFQSGTYRKPVELAITDPICALGWLRESTIRNRSANDSSKKIESFEKNLV